MTSDHEVHLVVPRAAMPDRFRELLEAGFVLKKSIVLPEAVHQAVYTSRSRTARDGKKAFRLAVEFVERTPEEPALVEWERVVSSQSLSKTSGGSPRAPLFAVDFPLIGLGCREHRGRTKSADVHVKLPIGVVGDEMLRTIDRLGLMLIRTIPSDSQPSYIVFGSQYLGPRWREWLDLAGALLSRLVVDRFSADGSIKTEAIVAFHLTRAHEDIPLAPSFR